MKKIIIIAALAISLGGCAESQKFWSKVETGVSLLTSSVTNPVTPARLAEVEASISVIFTGLKTYKTACVQGLADTNCKANIAAIQVYTRQVPPLLTQLRAFVKNNDQVNASVIYNQVQQLITNITPLANAAQVKKAS